MRAMGPGSVSSLLKIALDVVYVALWIGIGVLVIGALLVLIFPIAPNLVASAPENGRNVQVPITRPIVEMFLGAFAVYIGVLLVIVGRLRKIFLTLVAGDPFQPGNVRRLRMVGLGLAALAALNIGMRMAAAAALPGVVRPGGGWPDLTAWFSVLVVFVLAEVFREGARLRREAELTI